MPEKFFEKIGAQLKSELPFVAYRKPKDTTIHAIFQMTDELHELKNYSETGFVFAPFSPKLPTVLLRVDEKRELSGFTAQNFIRKTKTVFNGTEGGREFHINLVNKALAEIKADAFEKVVLSRQLNVAVRTSAVNLFQRLLATYPSALNYLWYHPKIGLWLGATPEILLMARNRHLTTMSLAGTQLYKGEPNPIWGNKELEEQELVTKYINRSLEGKVDEVNRGQVESVRAGNLMHLRTKISGHLVDNDLGNVLKALHPTPAVCGLPKNVTKDFILENENYDREFYTGYLGELNFKLERPRNPRSGNFENEAYRSVTNTTTLFVNLRCMQLKGDMAQIYVGGGITKDSDPEKEWEETVSKSKTLLQIL